MSRMPVFSFARGFFGVVLLTVAIGCAGGFSSPQAGGRSEFLPDSGSSQGKIRHVVIIVQENRTFDNFFDCFPGTDCVTTAPGPDLRPRPGTKKSPCPGPVPTRAPGPTPTPIALKFGAKLVDYDLEHNYCPAFRTEYDDGKMDGFYWVGGIWKGKPSKLYAYQVVDKAQIQPYWDLATQYVLADHAFPTQSSGSFTAHQDLIRGDTTLREGWSAVDFPWNNAGINNWGCDDAKNPPAGPSYTPELSYKLSYRLDGPFPCFDYKTIRDLLDAKGITWKYYVPPWPTDGGQMWNAFDAVKSVRYSSEWPNHGQKPFTCTGSCVSWPQTNVLCDVAGSTASPCPSPNPKGDLRLPAVSWVIPDNEDSDHYDGMGTDNGPDWVASVVNAIGESSYWKGTAIVILWDDWGGFYDHVPPPQLDYKGLGFRVPFMIVSPYAKKGYVSHTQYEFGSILKFVESTFDLPSLGTTDARANNLTDAFDFSQKPRKFKPIKLLNKHHDAMYFLRRGDSGQPVDSE